MITPSPTASLRLYAAKNTPYHAIWLPRNENVKKLGERFAGCELDLQVGVTARYRVASNPKYARRCFSRALARNG